MLRIEKRKKEKTIHLKSMAEDAILLIFHVVSALAPLSNRFDFDELLRSVVWRIVLECASLDACRNPQSVQPPLFLRHHSICTTLAPIPLATRRSRNSASLRVVPPSGILSVPLHMTSAAAATSGHSFPSRIILSVSLLEVRGVHAKAISTFDIAMITWVRKSLVALGMHGVERC